MKCRQTNGVSKGDYFNAVTSDKIMAVCDGWLGTAY